MPLSLDRWMGWVEFFKACWTHANFQPCHAVVLCLPESLVEEIEVSLRAQDFCDSTSDNVTTFTCNEVDHFVIKLDHKNLGTIRVFDLVLVAGIEIIGSSQNFKVAQSLE